MESREIRACFGYYEGICRNLKRDVRMKIDQIKKHDAVGENRQHFFCNYMMTVLSFLSGGSRNVYLI